MRLLVTGVSGLLGSNVAAAAAQQSWSVLGTFHTTPVSLPSARTTALDLGDRHACVTLAETLGPDVIVHAGALHGQGGCERPPRLAELDLLGVQNTLAAARAVRAQYVLVSGDLVYSGALASGERWGEDDPTEPTTQLGRSLLAREQLVEAYAGSWLITRPADVYGVNLALPAPAGDPAADALARARHVWERSGQPPRWVAALRAGRLLLAPPDVRRTPTYAWDYAQRLCELIAQECEGVFNTAGPTILGRLAQMRLLARAFDCEMELVRDGPRDGSPAPLPLNTALGDDKSAFILGHSAIDPFNGHRLMRRQLERLLGNIDPPPPARRAPGRLALIGHGLR
ncbi:MAG TPA: sugar nucleotide-binding protein [Solirubrobacteraceae bacterium]|jgi:dTDP-4-dehydrorhamnose reductase|nr:sugar nucleotide-binding protein [Solirubrobacteraceae bacterium]